MAKRKTPKVQTKAQTVFETNDGFQNFAAKLGVGPGRGVEGTEDNLISKGHYEFNLITRNRVQLEAAYRGSWIVGQVVDAIAEDMTRAGIQITTNEGAEKIPELKTMMSRLQIWSSLKETIQWGRLYGGAIGVMQIDGQDLSDPLDLEGVGEGDFKGIIVYDRWQLYPVLSKLINSGPNLGLPEYYDIVLGSNLNDPGQEPGGLRTDKSSAHVCVHHSRCVRIDGIKLPFFQAITEMMWGESVLERMWDRLIAFDDATLNAAGLIHRANLRTIGVEKFREIMAAGGKAQQALVAQFDMMRLLQSNERLTVMDKEDTFSSTSYTFAGLSDVMLQMFQQVSGSAGIPMVRLCGQTPAGLGSNADGDIRLYYDSVNAKQEVALRNPLEDILKVMWRSLTGEAAPEDLAFTFVPLWQMSAIDKANVAKLNADTIIEAAQANAIDTSTMMKELKQNSAETGLFTHITDEAIEEAENDLPPGPETEMVGPGGSTTGDPGEGPKTANEKPAKGNSAKSVADSAWAKVKRWLAKDAGNFKEGDHPRKSNGEFGSGRGKEIGASSNKSKLSSHEGRIKKIEEQHSGATEFKKMQIAGVEVTVYKDKHRSYRFLAPNGSDHGPWKKFSHIKNSIFRKMDLEKGQSKDAAVNDPGIPGTMKEFAKGTLKSSSGKKVTSKKQTLAIGYSEEGKDSKVSDAQRIRDWLASNK